LESEVDDSRLSTYSVEKLQKVAGGQFKLNRVAIDISFMRSRQDLREDP
jgi:hypothetical protein